MARNETLVQVREFIRQPFAWPGGYPKVLHMTDGGCLCAACAKANYRQISRAAWQDDKWGGWAALGVDLHLEGEPLVCSNCNVQIESAYGSPDS